MERNRERISPYANLYEDLYNMGQDHAAFEAARYRVAKEKGRKEEQVSAGRAVMYYLLRRTGLDILADVPLVGENGYYKDEAGDNITVVDYLASGLGGHAEPFLLNSVRYELDDTTVDTLRGALSASILHYTPQDHPHVEAFLAAFPDAATATRPTAVPEAA